MSWRKNLKLMVLYAARSAGLFALGRFITRNSLLIVGWHGVSLHDEHERFRTLFISPDEFRRRLRHLTSHFRVISLDDAVRQHQSGRFKRRQVVLTFDDGYYNFMARAVPILREFGATATVYMVTAPMVSQLPKHNLLLRDIALATPLTTLQTRFYGIAVPRSLQSTRDRESLAAELNRELRTLALEGDAATEFCREAGRWLDVDVDARIEARTWHCMSAAEAKALADEGFSIQLHTHTHRNVVHFPNAIAEEVATCRRIVEETTSRPALDFCYPTGLWNKGAWPVLKACGIRSAVTTRTGPNFASTPLLALRRHLTGQASTQIEFEFELTGLRWLAQVLVRPARFDSPSEKERRYSEDGTSF